MTSDNHWTKQVVSAGVLGVPLHLMTRLLETVVSAALDQTQSHRRETPFQPLMGPLTTPSVYSQRLLRQGSGLPVFLVTPSLQWGCSDWDDDKRPN